MPKANCAGCPYTISPDDAAVLLVKSEPIYGGSSIDPTDFRDDQKITHKGHEDEWVARGYRIVREGPLRDLNKAR